MIWVWRERANFTLELDLAVAAIVPSTRLQNIFLVWEGEEKKRKCGKKIDI